MLTLENHIVGELIEQGDGDEFRRDQIVQSYAENVTNELMSDLGLMTEESFVRIYKAVLDSIRKEVDWNKVDNEMTEMSEDTASWFGGRMEAIFQ